ncbi:MAG: hypothetical protein QOD26_2870 [Betaproteobacteria bacterium]|jgi:hypothetical protein|nr:hypothetical protein [Betaproteobacteria bacterium]
MQPVDIAIALRRRTPWEAMDLGLAMLQRWWRQAYVPHLAVGIAVALIGGGLGAWAGKTGMALFIVWWLKPLYDRVVLHVLSRAVFGEVQSARQVLGSAREWLGTGLFMALTFGRFDSARSFNLPVRQLEGQRARAGRERRGVLGRRVSSYATWLTIVCMHFEAVLYWSLGRATSLFLPAKALEARDFTEAFLAGDIFGASDLLAYVAAVLLLEPFYVAAGFALYLNRRTLLEGWDIEVALRKITQRHAAAVMLVVCCMMPMLCFSQEQKNPKSEIAEVLQAKEFPHQIETMQWQRIKPLEPQERPERPKSGDGSWLGALGYALANAAQVLFWGLAAAAIAYAIWWAVRMLPRARLPVAEAYRAPASLFGMEIAPEKLPADVGAAAAALARAGRLREALGLLYRGALSDLVHRRGVELLASHTELEALQLAQKRVDAERSAYLQTLVRVWRECAYSRRAPRRPEVESLAADYKVIAAP